MCNHNLYSCISHHNKEAFDTLMSNFGDVPVGGNIYCKICGHYLCPESFSTLEGFSDDKPSNTREVLNTDLSQMVSNIGVLAQPHLSMDLSLLVIYF